VDLYQLECFRVVADMQHISNAAMVLHITQSALSKIINRVEDYAGTPLFDRVKGKIYLNESGVIFAKSLDSMFEALNSGLKEIRTTPQFQQYQVYVASNADSLLFHVSEEFFSTHTDTNIKYSVMSPEQIRDGFLHGKLDIALTTFPMLESGMIWEELAQEELLLVAAGDGPFAGRKSISFAELNGVEIMCESLGGDMRTLVDRCCAKAGFHANVVLESNIGSAIGFHSGLKRAVCFMPAHRYMQIVQTQKETGMVPMAENRILPVALRLTDPTPVRVTGITHRTEGTLTPQAQGMYEYLVDYFTRVNAETKQFMQDYFAD
jgi:DNA-binding transcriptional LysR family regulator